MVMRRSAPSLQHHASVPARQPVTLRATRRQSAHRPGPRLRRHSSLAARSARGSGQRVPSRKRLQTAPGSARQPRYGTSLPSAAALLSVSHAGGLPPSVGLDRLRDSMRLERLAAARSSRQQAAVEIHRNNWRPIPRSVDDMVDDQGCVRSNGEL